MQQDAPAIALLATLDTKGEEAQFVAAQIQAAGGRVVLIDVGVYPGRGPAADVAADAVARAAGADLPALRRARDRGAAVEALGRGATEVVRRLYAEGSIQGVLAIGGSGGASLAAGAMQALPTGTPRMLVSTVATGDVGSYVGGKDIAMLYSVVDIAGLNRISRRVLANAAGGIVGMARAAARTAATVEADRPLVAATMFGVTTPCVTRAREILEAEGYEVLVFHATGTGGRTMEALVDEGHMAGVLDVTTTEWADELVGGVLSAGPTRLEAMGRRGVPHVVAPGALDMVNFGSPESVPMQFAGRRFYRHNPQVTLMRTTPEECAQLGRIIAGKLHASAGPVELFLPLRGVSAIDASGQPFEDAAADAALFGELRTGLVGAAPVHEMDLHINDPAFAEAMARRLIEMMSARGTA
jgi:uncharacterized protein (UPF0261 family)